MKTSKVDFNKFRKSFLRWADRLKCGYHCYFLHEPLEDVFANIVVSESGKTATVRYNSKIDKVDYSVRPSPEETGRHEAIHLFLHRMHWLGEQRYMGSDEIDHEWERLVRVLEKVL